MSKKPVKRRKVTAKPADEDEYDAKGEYVPHKRVCDVKIVGISPYSQSKVIETPRRPKEEGDAYDERCWSERMHVDDKGVCFIPASAFKKALETASSFLRERVPGKGKSEFGKHFRAGVLIVENPTLGVKAKDVKCERVYVNADGKSGSGSRVWRRYPLFPKWQCDVEFIIVDGTVTEEVFERHLREAGQLVGIGRWRGEVGGMYGRFVVKSMKWRNA